MKTSELKIKANNPRLIKDARYRKLKKSIQDFPKMMELRPIVYDPNTMEVLGGNMRLKAIRDIGMKEIPDNWVKSADELTEEEKKRFVITDNAGFGEWDDDILKEQWGDLPLAEWGLDDEIDQKVKPKKETKELIGFNQAHILISYNPDLHDIIQQAIAPILNTNGIEIERSAN